MRTNARLVLMLADSRAAKLEHGDDDVSVNMGSCAALPNQVSREKLPSLSQHDYPLVRYWERKVWKSFASTRKDTSEVQTKSGSRGGTRSSKGENVMMLYIEDADGKSIDGNIAGGMRDFARSIWRSLYERGIAPETWGQATKEVREEYCREMESEYHVLRLCDNHWKANALATAIYSQWYRTYDKKTKHRHDNDNSSDDDSNDNNNSDDDTGDGSNGPPRKKAKTTSVVDDDTDITPPEPEAHVDKEGASINATPADASSHHRAALVDPLCVTTQYYYVANPNASSSIFAQPTSQFRVLESVPKIIQQGIDADQHDTNRTAGTVAVENTDQVTDADLVVPTPDASNINTVRPATSGLASASTAISIEATPTGDGIPIGAPQTGTCTGPDPIDSTPSASTSTPDHDPAALKVLFQKRYLHKAKMVPGGAVTAR